MKSNLELAREFYEALARSDAEALLELLHPDFEGEVTAGLPRGFGGTYQGPQAQLADCWARVAAVLDARPEPSELLIAERGTIVALGSYIGRARETGKHLDAAFAHVLRFRNGRMVSLRQITDSQRWVEALEPDTRLEGARSTRRPRSAGTRRRARSPTAETSGPASR
jgi:ketosteroid isomerase-like protein